MAKSQKKSSLVRKLILGIGGLVGLLVVTALVLPFVIDLNRFKPQVKQAVSDAVYADIDFDSIRLTILTGLGVKLQNVTITNTDPNFSGTKMFSVEDLTFRVDLMPLLEKRFEGYLSIDAPEIVMATKGVKNNFAALTKPTKPSDKKAAAEEAPKEDEPEASPEDIAKREALVEEFKKNIIIRSVRIDDAKFLMTKLDSKQKDPVRINDLDIHITDIGLEQDIKTHIATDVDVNESGITLSGPITVDLVTKISTQGTKFEVATFDGKLSFDQFSINAMDAFVKKPGVALNLAFAGAAKENAFDLNKMTFNLHNLAVSANAHINDFQALQTKAQLAVTNDDLSGLGEVLPQHKDMLVKGKLAMKSSVAGLLSDLEKLKAGLALKTQLTGSDLALQVVVLNAKAPVVKTEVSSQRLDLGAILEPFMPKDTESKGKSEKKEASKTASTEAKDETPPEDFSLSPELKELLAPANIQAQVNMKHILFDPLEIKNFVINTKFANLKADLDPLSLDIFDGNIAMKGHVDLNPSPISFTGSVDMNGVETQKIIEMVAEEHKDLLHGKANINLNVRGEGTTIPTLNNTLNGKGSFVFLDGELNTGSVAAKMGQELDSFIAGSSVTGVASGAFQKAESLLKNPMLQKSGALKDFDLSQKKAQFDGASQVRIADKLTTEKSLKDTKGEIEIIDGKIHITSEKASDSGTMDMDATVSLDTSLGGQAVFIASSQLKNDMIKQSKYAPLFFDQQGNLQVPMKLSGYAADPKVSLDLAALKDNFKRNAQKAVTDEIEGELNRLKNDVVGAKMQQAKAELAKKKAELKAKADAKRKELAEKKKQKEQELRRKAEEARKKKEAEAKAKAENKLKDKLKNKIPGF